MEPILRVTARVLPVADDGTCLLLLEQDPARPGALYWGTVGGAAESGESLEAAAVREMREETGIALGTGDLTAPFHHRVTEFSWNGVAYRGDSTFFATSLDRGTEVSFEHLEPEEVGNVFEARWLTPQEADRDGRLVWDDLGEIMTRAVAAVRGEL